MTEDRHCSCSQPNGRLPSFPRSYGHPNPPGEFALFRLAVRAVVTFSLAVATAAFGDAPVKTQRTLLMPDQVAAMKENSGFVHLAMNGDNRPFTAAVGYAPAEKWVEKPDDWFWEIMPSTEIVRCTTVGNDNFRTPKAGCPVHGEKIYEVDAYYPWIVDGETMPYKLKCPIGGETYPSNDFASGDLKTGPYPDDGSGYDVAGRKYHFIGLYAHYAYNTILQPAIKSFGHAYLLTGDRRYAHKAAVCLLKEAFEYPNSTDRKDRTYLPGYEPGSGMISDVVWSGGALIASATCYDEVCEALDGDEELLAFARKHVPEITTIGDVKVYIEDRLFRSGLQALLDGRILPNTGWAEEAMATLALMMNDFGHKKPNSGDCLEWLYYGGGRLVTVGNQFYKDGSSYESTGYNEARSGFVRCADTLKRLRTLAPKALDWERYPDISQNEKLLAYTNVYSRAIRALDTYTICVGDIGSTSVSRKPLYGPGGRSSEFLDGYGLGILRSGRGQHQRDATLFYGGVRGHAHYDPLMLGLHGFGRDLLPNIGYPQSWNFAYAWEWSLFTHNTVVVDRDEKPCSTVIGSITVWSPGENDAADSPVGRPDARPAGVSGVQVIEASKRPYRINEPRGQKGPDVTDYRRMVALVDISQEQWYAVDIFRVNGGCDHLQSWHGGYTPNPMAVEGATLTQQAKGTLAGEDVAYGQHYQDRGGGDRWDPYCYLHSVSRGPMQAVTSVDFAYATDDNLHLRLNFVPMDDTELITARGGAPIAPDKEVLQWAIPHRVLPSPRGAGAPAALRSQFVTVPEPYLGRRFLSGIRRLPAQAVGESDYAPIALEVSVPGGRDIILANGSESASLRCGEFALTGKFGLIRERDGKVVELRLVAGSKLSAGKLQVIHPSPGIAKIAAVDREKRALTVEGTLPPLHTLTGSRIAIDNHGERICSYTVVAASTISENRVRLIVDSSGNIGEGIAVGFDDGFIRNGPEVNMPLAGLVKIGDQFDYGDCLYNGGHLENGKPGVDYKVHGVMGFPYQAWGSLHIAGINHVVLYDRVPAQELREAIGENGRWTIYEYGVGDEVRFDSGASLVVE